MPGTSYVGRFAPSPSGPLHFGSIVTAVASYLRAKSQAGKWLVRIEDIDPARQPADAIEQITNELLRLGLDWDDELIFQSNHAERYRQILKQLLEAGTAYPCRCTRARLKSLGGLYDGHCQKRHLPEEQSAIRLLNPNPPTHFIDEHQGKVVAPADSLQDFIIHRKDGLFAYQLAVVVDDFDSNISEVVRGSDLLVPTFWQLSLYQALGITPPKWLHLPLAMGNDGRKLSKQNHAEATWRIPASQLLCDALQFLGQNIPKTLAQQSPKVVLEYALENFDVGSISQQNRLWPE